MEINQFVWVEKYRPTTIDQCFLPKKIKTMFHSFMETGNVPNMIFAGSPGTGKTSSAIAMLEEMNRDYMKINGSLSGNIDTLRYDIKNFAESLSLFKPGRKYVIIDEADYLNANSTQPALRTFMEEYSKNCGFILTCNHKNRIIPALQSRCSLVEFKIDKAEVPHLMAQFFARVKSILDIEEIKYDNQALAKFIQLHYPDMRKVLVELQREATSGSITSSVLVNFLDSNFKELIKAMKAKNFTQLRSWVSENDNIDFTTLMRGLYDGMGTLIKEADQPTLVALCGEWQYKAAFAVDQQVNTAAFLTQVMANVDFQ